MSRCCAKQYERAIASFRRGLYATSPITPSSAATSRLPSKSPRRLADDARAPCCGLALYSLRSLFAEPAPQFVEITEEAGLDFRYVNGASGHKYMVEAVGSGAAFFDDDGDGWLDLYIVNGAPMPGYRGPS